MNVLRKDIDAVNAILSVQISKADYAQNVENTLKEYRKKAQVPGFRPGMVPAGLIKKMYGKSVLAQEVNKLISDNLYGFIKENNIAVLGEPLPNTTEQKEINFDTDEDFEFVFDIAIAPELDFKLDKKTKLTYYDIEVSEKMIDDQVKSYAGRFGTYEQVEEVDAKDVLKGTVEEIGGAIKAENVVLCPEYMKNEAQKSLFVGAKKGATVTFSPAEAYENNEIEISSFLKIKKEEVKNIGKEFAFTIGNITRYKESPIDQTLFDKAFGEGNVKSEAEFRAKISESLKETLKSNSEYKFALDVKQAICKKIEKVAFPEAFLKRWILETNEKYTAETLEQDFPKILEDLKWQVASDKIAKDSAVKVEKTDIEAQARKVTKAQFAQYGMNNIPDDVIENYVQDMMQKDETVKNLVAQALESKILEAVKSSVAIDEKPISVEEFGELFQSK